MSHVTHLHGSYHTCEWVESGIWMSHVTHRHDFDMFMRVCKCKWCVAVCCSVLQCVAVCCRVLQCVAVCCSVSQRVAVCRSVLQCVAVCSSMLQCVAVWEQIMSHKLATLHTLRWVMPHIWVMAHIWTRRDMSHVEPTATPFLIVYGRPCICACVLRG